MATSKEAHTNREALKKAGRQDRLPNLLMTRLARQQSRRSQGPLWPAWVIFLLLFGVLAFLLRKNLKTGALPPGVAIFETSKTAPGTEKMSTETPTPAAPEVAKAPTPSAPVEEAKKPAAPAASAPVATKPAAPAPVPAPAKAATSAPSLEFGKPAPRFARWKGFYSPIKKYREVVIDSPKAWADLWKEMGQAGLPPAIDFSEERVVGIFLGDSPQGSDIALYKLQAAPSHLIVPYHIFKPAPGSPGTDKTTQPFYLKTVLNLNRPLRFVEDTKLPAPPGPTE